jgi:hypothetical protein
MNPLPCLKIYNFLHVLLLFPKLLVVKVSEFLAKNCQGLKSGTLDSSIEGSLGCIVVSVLNHPDSVAPLLLIQRHLHTSYRGTSEDWSPYANVEGCMVLAVQLE